MRDPVLLHDTLQRFSGMLDSNNERLIEGDVMYSICYGDV